MSPIFLWASGALQWSGKSEASLWKNFSLSSRLDSSNEISPAPRPHGLSHYSLEDFPMSAKDIDSEIEVHFDITGNSVTEGNKQ